MEERRSNGFRVKPSFGQVLGFIQESEPLASIYTSSHFYLDDYPNAPEPISETPLPHTSLNPAAVFETADEGYSGTPFPRPPREFTRPSFLPDSDDGGMDPGQALRNDGLNPPRPPTLGGRMRESGIQAAEAIGPAGWRRLAGQDPSHPEAAPGTGPPTGRSATTANHRTAFGSGAPAGEGEATSGGGGTASRPGHRELRFPAAAEAEASEGFATAAEAAAGAAEAATAAEAGTGALALLGEGARPEPWALRRAAWPSREQALLSSARPGPSREDLMRRRTCGVPPPEAVRTATPRGPLTPPTRRL